MKTILVKISLPFLISTLFVSISTVLIAQDKTKGFGLEPDSIYDQRDNSLYTPYKRMYYFGVPSPHNANMSSASFNSVKESESIAHSLQTVGPFDYYILGTNTSGEYRQSQILESLSSIQNKVSNPGAWVILFLSGHGVVDNGMYYFIAEDSNLNNLTRTAISGNYLRETLKKLANDGHKVVLFLDTCYSGSLFDSSLSNLSNPTGGIAIFASSKSDEFSYESSLYGGSRYAQQIAYAFNGENAEAANSDGNVTFSSLRDFLYKKVSNQQTPQLALYGSFKPETPIVERLPKLVEYFDILERYRELITEIDSAIQNKDYLQALTIARTCDLIGVATRDRRDGYSTKYITQKYKVYIGSLSYAEIERIGKSLPSYSDIIDKSILNENAIEVLKGESLKQNKEYSKALSHFLKTYNQTLGSASVLYQIIELYSNNIPTDISDDEIKQLIALYPQLQNCTSFKHEDLARFLYRYCDNISLKSSREAIKPACDDLVLKMWQESAHSDNMTAYAAQAILNKGDKQNALELIKGIVLKDPSKSINDLNYKDIKVFSSDQSYTILMETIPTNVAQRIEKQRKGSYAINDIEYAFWNFGDNFVDTESKFGVSFQIGYSPKQSSVVLPLGLYAEYDYKFLHFAVEGFLRPAVAIAYATANTKTLLESTEKPLWSAGGCIGINFMNYVTLDFGMGALGSKFFDKYEITTGSTSSTSISTSTIVINGESSATNTSTINMTSPGSTYFYIKPGIRGYIPIGYNGLKISLGVSYLICPKNNTLNTLIGSLGVARVFE